MSNWTEYNRRTCDSGKHLLEQTLYGEKYAVLLHTEMLKELYLGPETADSILRCLEDFKIVRQSEVLKNTPFPSGWPRDVQNNLNNRLSTLVGITAENDCMDSMLDILHKSRVIVFTAEKVNNTTISN